MLPTLRRILFFLLIIPWLNGCRTEVSKSGIKDYFDRHAPRDLVSRVSYAEGFDLYQWGGITKLLVYHPESRKTLWAEYYLAPEDLVNEFKGETNLFKIPVDSVAVFSATQLNALDKLHSLERVIGVSEADYIINLHVREKLERGEIEELAVANDFFVEKTLSVNPSLIFCSPIKLNEPHALAVTGIPLLYYFDYYETDPLGRAEWILFTAAFLGKLDAADSIFGAVSQRYEELKRKASEVQHRPAVFSDKYFNGQWFVPGGKSYFARLFKDAGADYLWAEDDHRTSFPLDYEVVYEKAHDAEFWRIIGSYGDRPTYAGLMGENELYQHFRAFREKKVIYCNARETAYFETSPLEPHILLADLIKAFHPDLLPDYEPRFYRMLTE